MNRCFLLCGAVLAVGLSGQFAFTQTPPPTPGVQQTAAGSTNSDLDPIALEALQKMVAHLGTLKNFEVTTRTTVDQIIPNGQKIQMDGGATYKVQRPNGFFIETRSDRRVRQFYYDGKTFTMFSPRMGFYAQVPAPGTISEVLQKLEDNYDVTVPLNDLFRWGSQPEDVKAIKSGMRVGYAKIGAFDCDQYAFRQADVDWQIWIERGAKPLPRKVVITTLEDAAQPQYVVYLDWNEVAAFDTAAFNFVPPKDASKIEITRVSDTTTN
ncbi:MAG TPA: DUF2092 domain-containing protein [Hyphomonadaceae bacterium]|nr:DUF2092 domain-containing protein [Hyphomonadaceae bacterium]